MKISKFLPESYSDYPGKVASVVFTQGCNYKCPSCHAKQILNSKELISENKILDYLKLRKGWIDALVICGGEPTLQIDLKNFAKEVKDLGFLTKLDINGSNPQVLQDLLKENLVDYVAMDIKGPAYLYNQLTGKSVDLKSNLTKAISPVTKFPDYEFRTTICPVIRHDKISFMTPEEIIDATKMIIESTGNNTHKYFLQKFVSRTKEEMINVRLSKENLPIELQETPKEYLEEILKEVKKYMPNTKVR